MESGKNKSHLQSRLGNFYFALLIISYSERFFCATSKDFGNNKELTFGRACTFTFCTPSASLVCVSVRKASVKSFRHNNSDRRGKHFHFAEILKGFLRFRVNVLVYIETRKLSTHHMQRKHISSSKAFFPIAPSVCRSKRDVKRTHGRLLEYKISLSAKKENYKNGQHMKKCVWTMWKKCKKHKRVKSVQIKP